MSVKVWIKAARLRTLPLAISTMCVGHSLAYDQGDFDVTIFILSLMTSISLQILSNLANDYGDSIHGADHDGRKGPDRQVQIGGVSALDMRNASWIFACISLILGTILVFVAFDSFLYRFIFWALGVLAVWAAYNYTAGNNPYGYSGKGDLSVFIFFGLVTVVGGFFLQTKFIETSILLPAIACGTLSVAVLNVNNIRDIESDSVAGKRSVPVKIGRIAAINYHIALIVFALACLIVYNVIRDKTAIYDWMFLLGIPFLYKNIKAVKSIMDALMLDPFLKQMAVSTSITLLLFSLGNFI